jgi:outer membrane murein-binding lipoprotein Lpp
MKQVQLVFAVLLTGLLFAGCSREASVPAVMRIDLTSNLSQIKMAAEKMDAKALKKKIEAYQAASTYKQHELQQLGDKFRQLPAEQMQSGEASRLQTAIALIENTIQAINERLQVYKNELQGKTLPDL